MSFALNTQGACCGNAPTLFPAYHARLDQSLNPFIGSGVIAVARASAGTFRDSTLRLVEVGADTVRQHHDDSGISVGALEEGSRSNFMLWSEDFSNAVWVAQAGAAVAAAPAIVNPKGELGGVYAITGGTAANAGVKQVNGTFAATTHDASCFVKFKDSTKCALAVYDNTGTAVIARVIVTFDGSGNITSAALDSGAVAGATVGYSVWYGGWYRVWVNGLATAVARAMWVYNRDPATATTNTVGTYFYGAELESTGSTTDASAPSSYKRTEGSTNTRAAETLTVDVTALGLSFAGVTIAIKYWKQSGPSATHSLVSLSDGTTANDVYLRVLASGVLDAVVNSASSDTATGNTVNTSAAGFNMAAISLAANDAFMSLNGGTGVQDSTITLPVGSPTTLKLGSTAAGATQLNGAISEIIIFASALDDATTLALAA
jgi:hypothetical protein